MRVILVVPSRRDPAHRRVLEALRREHEKAGLRVSVFASQDGARLERLLAKADVCHIQYFSRGLRYLGRVRFPSRVRVLLTHQGASLDLLEHPKAFARLAQRANVITSVSREGLGEIRRRFVLHHSSIVIPNGTDRGGEPPTTSAKTPFILSVARLAAYKGSDILLMAYANLDPEERPKLVLCGPDQSEGRLAGFMGRLGLKKDVRILGQGDFKTVSRLFRDCLFFILPSRSENMPMALLEAMAAGKAVLASDTGGIPDIIDDGRNGLLVPPKDVAALSQAMRRLIHDGPLRRRLGRAARARAKGFSWESAARRYRSLYA